MTKVTVARERCTRPLAALPAATERYGRVEVDCLVCPQSRCLVLEVFGQPHLEGEQAVRDYARDRLLLRAALRPLRFTGKNCLERPQAVVEACLAIRKLNQVLSRHLLSRHRLSSVILALHLSR